MYKIIQKCIKSYKFGPKTNSFLQFPTVFSDFLHLLFPYEFNQDSIEPSCNAQICHPLF